MPDLTSILIFLFIATQLLYLLNFLLEGYFLSLPVNRVDPDTPAPARLPYIVLFYPVLNELESTMRTTFEALARLDYPRDRFEVIAIPNGSDVATTAALRSMQRDFAFLKVTAVPPTTDGSWDAVWRAWSANPKVYWWHAGSRAGVRDLPSKKTRQLIYAFYTHAEARAGQEDYLVNYLDADSVPPADHFMMGAKGMQHYDVLQSTNIAGNLLATWPASFHSFDHMAWDGRKYRHMSANGRHPFWVLGKGLFFRGSDLVELGGFNPWITIEDPEVGMRFWKNGRRLGIIEAPLIEEVPETFGHGITQRKRWVAGFYQSLTTPLKAMDFTFGEKCKAWLNFIPCLSLWINLIGLPVGIWAGVTWYLGIGPLPTWTIGLSLINIVFYIIGTSSLYWRTWQRTAIVLANKRDRLRYLLRINPISLWVWWFIWLVPLAVGYRMYRRDQGLTWERTEKIDANNQLVRDRLAKDGLVATTIPQPRGT